MKCGSVIVVGVGVVIEIVSSVMMVDIVCLVNCAELALLDHTQLIRISEGAYFDKT